MPQAFDIGAIDEVIHGRVRLGVLAYLAAEGIADFNTLKAKLEVNEGTLSVHLRKLEEAGVIEIIKGYRGRRPLTQAKLTEAGRAKFKAYLEVIGKLAGLV
jgi:DNA-binding MarR family transcriptional regulator